MSELRLRSILERHLADSKSLTQLANRIASANTGHNDSIDRRKLKDILEDEKDYSLRVSEFTALNRYLAQNGESLAHTPLFQTLNTLREVALLECIRCFVGSWHIDRREHTSMWDAKAYSRLAGSIYSMNGNASVQLGQAVRVDCEHSDLREQRMRSLLEDNSKDRCLISLGSPLLSDLSELMLCDIFEMRPFVQGHYSDRGQVPFQIVGELPSHSGQRVPSRFTVAPDEFRVEDFPQIPAETHERIRAGMSKALIVGQHCLCMDLKEETSSDYAVVTIQRRRSGQVWMVVAGLSGSSTYYACCIADQIQMQTPSEPHTSFSVIKVDVVQSLDRDGVDDRKVVGGQIIIPNLVWSREEEAGQLLAG